jgi:DNA-binding NarL/FixJ family response regulator
MHALIIEDEFLVALNIEDSLIALGFASSETVVTEEEAVVTARRRAPDLITADVRLLRGTGIAAGQFRSSSSPATLKACWRKCLTLLWSRSPIAMTRCAPRLLRQGLK